MTNRIGINRAPVLILWAAVVAECLGYEPDTALTLGKAVAGMNAQSKGRSLGIFGAPTEQKPAERQPQPAGEQLTVELLGRLVPAIRTEAGIRATSQDRPVDAQSIRRYLEQKFGADLVTVRAAMEALAGAYESPRLAAQSYALYEQFRPDVPKGKRGWGATGELDLDQIRSLARQKG
jgi:hypothetical protein